MISLGYVSVTVAFLSVHLQGIISSPQPCYDQWPNFCKCDEDSLGRKRVMCGDGNMTVPPNFDVGNLTSVEKILVVTGNGVPPTFATKSGTFIGKTYEEVHLTSLLIKVAKVDHLIPTLGVLNLTKNAITSLDDYSEFKNLRHIYLDHNKIKQIGGFADTMNSLETLGLSHNPIEDITGDAGEFCSKMPHLKTLLLAENKMPPNTWEKIYNRCVSLQTLNMSQNSIELRSHSQFAGLPALKDLILANCTIGSVTAGSFDGTHLSMLDLSGANFTSFITEPDTLPVGFFKGARTETLNISDMDLTSLSREDLAPLAPGLTALDISGNPGLQLDSAMFSQLFPLKRIFLARLNLTDVSNELFLQNNIIEVLDLSHNKLTTIADAFFWRLSHIRMINLANNRLKAIPKTIVQSTVTHIDLTGNQLVNLHSDLVYALAALPKLFQLRLNDNPWKCDCELIVLHMWLRNDTSPSNGFAAICAGNRNSVCPVCHDPQGYHGLAIGEAQFTAGCSIPAAPPTTIGTSDGTHGGATETTTRGGNDAARHAYGLFVFLMLLPALYGHSAFGSV